MQGSSAGELTILIIENDPVLRNWLTEVLVKEKYRVFEADNAAEARRVSASFEGAIDLIIASADEGHEVVGEIQSSRPSVKVLEISSRSQEATRSDHSFLPQAEFLLEPMPRLELVETVSRLLARQSLLSSAAGPGVLPN